MRFGFSILIFLLLIEVGFSYDYSPFKEVIENNIKQSKNLFEDKIVNVAVFDKNNAVIGGISLLSVSPSVDNRIPSSKELYLFWKSTH